MSAFETYLNKARSYAGLVRHTSQRVDELGNVVSQIDSKAEEAHARINALAEAPARAGIATRAVTPVTAVPVVEAATFPIPKFWEDNYWEQTVQFALRDYCRPGDTVFDVGANAGALSMIMSRQVGPLGIVCSFEASPRIIDKTHHNLVQGGCTNVTLYYRAVYHTSGEFVTIYPGTHLNDSIYNDYGAEDGARYEVETLALDDFAAATGLMPITMKMDIEGAEFDALKGAERILSEAKPAMMLEQSPDDMRCHELLAAAGYIAVDLGDYRRINSAADFDAGVGIANILYIHRDKADGDAYVNIEPPLKVAELAAEDFNIAPSGDVALTSRIQLQPGRYVCKADFTANGTDNEIYCGLDTDRGRIMRYHTHTSLMAANYRDWVFDVRVATNVTPYIQFVRGTDASLKWNGATIYRYPSFDRLKRSVVF